MGPFGIIWEYLGPFGTIWDRLPYLDVMGRFRQFGTNRTILENSGPFLTFWDLLGPFGTIWDHWGWGWVFTLPWRDYRMRMSVHPPLQELLDEDECSPYSERTTGCILGTIWDLWGTFGTIWDQLVSFGTIEDGFYPSLLGLQDEDDCSPSPSGTTGWGWVFTLPCKDHRMWMRVHPSQTGLLD